MSYSIVHSEEAFAAAMACARGSYQRDLLRGRESLSGATLTGKAAGYGPHYARSRNNLLRRMTAAGVPWTEQRGPHNRRLLVIGEPPPPPPLPPCAGEDCGACAVAAGLRDVAPLLEVSPCP